jgi:PEP-CTERM motif
MKRLIWGAALLFAVSATCAYGDSISTFNLNKVDILFGINDGSGDNVGFVLTGTGTNIVGGGGIPCFDWCSFNTFSPGTSPPLGIGQVFLDSVFNKVLLGGISYDPGTIGLNGFVVNVLGGFTFPANPHGTKFTACVSAAMAGPMSGSVGSGDNFLEFNLTVPAGGKFCTTWAFSPVSNTYQFTQGEFVATSVPEPGTISFIATGLAGIISVIRRKRN